MEESTMGKLFVPYKESLELKELGFYEPCFMKIWWLNGIDFDTKKSFKPYITINDKEIRFKYHLPKKHPWSGIRSLDLQIPTFQQAFRWFRNKYKLPSHIATYWQHDWNNYSYQYYFVQNKVEWNGIEHYKTYEEAELACLRKLIDIVKENK